MPAQLYPFSVYVNILELYAAGAAALDEPPLLPVSLIALPIDEGDAPIRERSPVCLVAHGKRSICAAL